MVLGPILLSTSPHHAGAPPAVGSVLVGHVVQHSHTTARKDLNRYDWWYRDGQPLRQMWSLVHGVATETDLAMLCKNTRYLPNLCLDNIWAFLRLIIYEDMQSFVNEYLSVHDQQMHPLRGKSGKYGYVLDRPVYRFILDTAIFFGLPCIYNLFEMRMRQQKLQLELAPRLRQLMSQEIKEFCESVHIHNDYRECYMK